MTHRIPSVLAAEVVTVDHLSGGRVECAVGAAWNEAEHRELGIPFPPLRDRMDRLEEGVQVLKLLFTQDDVTFEGDSAVEHATYRPRPVQTPNPPIWIATAERRSLRSPAPMRRITVPDATEAPRRASSTRRGYGRPRPVDDPARVQPVDQRSRGTR